MTAAQLMDITLTVLRIIVGFAFIAAVLVAVTHWAVRTGKIAPFGGWATMVRRFSDPVVNPIEKRVLRMGGNPQDAPIWLVGGVTIMGLILLAAVDWIAGVVTSLYWAIAAGPRGILPVLTNLIFNILMVALLVRVFGSWIGASPTAKLMRLAHRLTDWLVDPIRRLLPPIGMFDFSPLVAWLLLSFLRVLLFRVFFW